MTLGFYAPGITAFMPLRNTVEQKNGNKFWRKKRVQEDGRIVEELSDSRDPNKINAPNNCN